MKHFFETTKDFALYAKISETTDWKQLSPIVDHAEVLYLYPYLGASLVNKIKEVAAGEIFETVRKIIANLAMMTAVTALSVRLSDSGITVAKKEGNNGGEGYVPASDSKIAALVKSYKERGYNYLNRLLSLLDAAEGDISKKFIIPNSFVPTVDLFKASDVDIQDSILTFLELRPYLNTTQRYDLQPILGQPLYYSLLDKVNSEELSNPEKSLIEEAQHYLCASAAAEALLRYSSPSTVESSSVPLSFGGGTYSYMAALYLRAAELSKGAIQSILIQYASDLGLSASPSFDNGAADAKIFVLG